MNTVNPEALIDDLIAIARRAGDAILEIYEQDFDVMTKSDESPLTQADIASHDILQRNDGCVGYRAHDFAYGDPMDFLGGSAHIVFGEDV